MHKKTVEKKENQEDQEQKELEILTLFMVIPPRRSYLECRQTAPLQTGSSGGVRGWQEDLFHLEEDLIHLQEDLIHLEEDLIHLEEDLIHLEEDLIHLGAARSGRSRHSEEGPRSRHRQGKGSLQGEISPGLEYY